MPDRATNHEPLPLRLPEGTVLGRFVVEGWVRDGGMAGLYRGRHAKTGERVAIKVQLPTSASDPSQRARFDREVDVMRRLAGEPHVVRLYDDGALGDGRRYLVSEWIEGENLEELLDRLRDNDRNLELSRVVALARELAVGLEAIHRHRIVHRDLKPANIMVTPSSAGGEHLRIVDFGVSADLGAGVHDQELTTAGMIIGTSGYMAPEQAAGVAAHPSFDVYAFGAVLYEAVTGARLPPSGWSANVVGSLTKLRPRVPPPLAELVAACLEQNPARRPESAKEIIARLEQVGSPSASMSAVAIRAVEEAAVERSRTAGRVVKKSMVRKRVRPEPRELQEESGFDRRWLWVLVIPLIGVGAWWALRRPAGVDSGDPGGTVMASHALTHATSTSAGHEGASGDTGGTTGGTASDGSTSSVVSKAGEDADAGVSAGLTDASGTKTGRSSNGGVDGNDSHPGLADPGSSETTGETSTSAMPTDYDDRRCARIRSLAKTAASRERWKEVLIHTEGGAECWEKTRDRTELRVQALYNLGEHTKCIREGTDSKSRRVTKFVDACRARLHEAG
jgi:Protein kinase domain